MQKTPSGGPHPSKKKKKREKKKKEIKIIIIKKVLQIKKCFSCGKWGIFAVNVLLNRDNKPSQSTPGSLELDLSSTTAAILTPDMPVSLIPM